MKIIHIADLHLDSSLEKNLDRQKAKKRKTELVSAFENVVSYATQNSVRLILVAGDMFDSKKVSLNTVSTVASIIEHAGEVDFLVLNGNHDNTNAFEMLQSIPQNLKFFGESWQYYDYENVTVGGILISQSNRAACENPDFKVDRYNIALMHGDIKSDIPLVSLRSKNIDYLALGHYHQFRTDRLDARASYVYSGCLESRGFDESGQKGFVLLDTDKNTFEFITHLCIRRMFDLDVDITGLLNYADIKEATLKKLVENSARPEDMVKIRLKGEFTLDTNKDLAQLSQLLNSSFYFAKTVDESTLRINPNDYKNDPSLKGEFVRNVLNSELSNEEKNKIIVLGIRAIRGEEL